jgi:hypothetical protein
MPGFKSEPAPATKSNDLGGGGGGSDEPPHPELHPIIDALLNALPEPGTQWPQSARMKWMHALNKAFDAIYKTGD